MRAPSHVRSGAGLIGLALALALLGTGPTPATASNDLPFLSVQKAKRYIRQALRDEFGATYARGHARYIDSCTRHPRNGERPGRVRCQVGWRRHRLSFEGEAHIWLRRNADGDVRWWYVYSIAETDEQCLEDGGTEDECVYVYDV